MLNVLSAMSLDIYLDSVPTILGVSIPMAGVVMSVAQWNISRETAQNTRKSKVQ